MFATTTVFLTGQISLDPILGWWFVVPFAAILLASLWLTITASGLSVRRRGILVSLRLLAMLVLFLGWLQPGMVTSVERETAGAIGVVIDQSESMQLPSAVSGKTRWDVAKELWQDVASATNLKIGETRLIPYFFDRTLMPAGAEQLPNLDKTFSAAPKGRVTDLGNALASIGRTQLDPPLRAVVLMTDGVQTLFPAEQAPTVVAQQMAQLDQPILVFGIGDQGSQSLVKDVAIEGMPQQFSAFLNKELSVPMVISAQGMQNQPIEVQLKLRADGKEQVVASRRILPSSASEKLPIEFTVSLPMVGEQLLVAEARVDTNEQFEGNNSSESFVTVREGGVKILYLEGQPRAEQLFLKRSLNESQDFVAVYRWFPERQRNLWPITPEVNIDEYDAFVIGDLDAAALSERTAQGIARRVAAGAGILFLGGYHSFDAGGYSQSPWDRVIPMRMTKPKQRWQAPVDDTLHVVGDIRLQPTRPHPITNLQSEPDNARLWQSLRPLDGMNRFGPLSQAAGTQVLLESQDKEPVLVTGAFNRGRVLAFAGDTTFHWFLAGGEQKRAHQQFWRQAMLWLVGRDSLSEGFQLTLDQRRFAIDATPSMSISWFGGSDNKSMPTSVSLELTRDGKWLRNVEATATGSQSMESRLVGLDAPGLYHVRLTAQGEDAKAYKADVAFIVRDDSRELSIPQADWQMLQNLAAANEAAGGKLFLPEEIDEALEWLRNRQAATKVTTIEKRRLGDAAWDAWLYLTVFCGLLSTEWVLRKSWQLP